MESSLYHPLPEGTGENHEMKPIQVTRFLCRQFDQRSHTYETEAPSTLPRLSVQECHYAECVFTCFQTPPDTRCTVVASGWARGPRIFCCFWVLSSAVTKLACTNNIYTLPKYSHYYYYYCYYYCAEQKGSPVINFLIYSFFVLYSYISSFRGGYIQ
jgi:hypothetical protein